MPTWPATLPKPVWDSIDIGAPEGAVLRTDMEYGPSKQRRRTTAAVMPVSLTFEPVTEAAYGDFEAFYFTDLEHGVLAFQMVHPITGAARQFRFPQTGQPWKITPVGENALRLTVSLELMP